MPKYNVFAIATASKFLGEFEADTEEAAVEMAELKADYGMSLCHHCGKEVEISEIDEIKAELIE